MLYKKKNKSKIWIIIGLIVIVAIGTVVCFALLKENDKLDESPKSENKKEEKFVYRYPLVEESNVNYYIFNGISNAPNGDRKIFYISQNHPRIKKLLSQGKLKEDKEFIIRYGKVDKRPGGKSVFIFKDDNKELEIKEV
jgi:hypothetical protein